MGGGPLGAALLLPLLLLLAAGLPACWPVVALDSAPVAVKAGLCAASDPSAAAAALEALAAELFGAPAAASSAAPASQLPAAAASPPASGLLAAAGPIAPGCCVGACCCGSVLLLLLLPAAAAAGTTVGCASGDTSCCSCCAWPCVCVCASCSQHGSLTAGKAAAALPSVLPPCCPVAPASTLLGDTSAAAPTLSLPLSAAAPSAAAAAAAGGGLQGTPSLGSVLAQLLVASASGPVLLVALLVLQQCGACPAGDVEPAGAWGLNRVVAAAR